MIIKEREGGGLDFNPEVVIKGALASSSEVLLGYYGRSLVVQPGTDETYNVFTEADRAVSSII